ncbi:MAG: chemotaxis protein CheD [Acidobacteriota bacterium]
MKRFFLHPGAVRFSDQPERIETILGSCVSVSLRDPVTAAAALSHCLLPVAPPSATDEDRYRFCDTAIEGMLAWFDQRCIPAARLEAKLFGGADVLIRSARSTDPTVGTLNAQHAVSALARFAITPQAGETGGEHGRYLIFDTTSGSVWIRPLAPGPAL